MKEHLYVLILGGVAALGVFGCSRGEGDEPDPPVMKAPEPVVDMGIEEMAPPAPLGEECLVKVNGPMNPPMKISLLDLTTGMPIEELDDSRAPNFRFDAQRDHEVEFTVATDLSTIPLAPLTRSFTVDQRCTVLDDYEFYTPVGMLLGEYGDGDNTFDGARFWLATDAYVMLVHAPGSGWYMIEERAGGENVNLSLPQQLLDAPGDAVVHLSPDARQLLVELDDTVALFERDGSGSLEHTGDIMAATPLRTFFFDVDGVMVALDASGALITIERGSANTSSLATDARGVTHRGGLWVVSEDESLRQITVGEGAEEVVGMLPAGTQRVLVSGDGTRALALVGARGCRVWEDRCAGHLLALPDLTPVVGEDAAPIIIAGVVAASAGGAGFGVVATGSDATQVIYISGEDGLVSLEDRALRGAPDAARSLVFEGGFALGMRQATVFATGPDNALIVDEGRWLPSDRGEGRVELIADPCESWECERVLWEPSRATRLGTTFALGSARDGSITYVGDAYDAYTITGARTTHVAYAPRVVLAPGVPSGAPCIPAIHTQVAFDRFVSAEEGLFCLDALD